MSGNVENHHFCSGFQISLFTSASCHFPHQMISLRLVLPVVPVHVLSKCIKTDLGFGKNSTELSFPQQQIMISNKLKSCRPELKFRQPELSFLCARGKPKWFQFESAGEFDGVRLSHNPKLHESFLQGLSPQSVFYECF